MDEEKLKLRIGGNIAACRRLAGLTQAGLAEKLNYSDKAVSKWERGESLPDVVTLMQLAELFDIPMAMLLADSGNLPEGNSIPEPDAGKPRADKGIIQALSSTLVWFVALLFFVVCSSFRIPNSWLVFFYAVPANAIVLLSLRSAWRQYSWNQALISIIVWGCLVSIHASLLVFLKMNVWKLYLLGIPGQIAIFLWFRMFRPAPEAPSEEENHG